MKAAHSGRITEGGEKMEPQTVILLVLALESAAMLLMALNQKRQAKHIAMLFKAMGMMIDITGDWILGSDEGKERAIRVYMKMAEAETEPEK